MSFQTSVIGDIRSGVIGELAFDGPTRAVSAVLDSASAANNVIGRAFCYEDTSVESVSAGGDAGNFAGILINPKTHPLYGTAGDTLAESLTLPNGTAVELLQMGEIYVSLATTGADIGAPVKYVDATGILDHGAPVAGETAVPNATVVRHVPSPTADGAFLAVIRLTN